MNLQKAPLDHITFELVDDDIHQWTVSFSSTGGSLATAVQGDGKYVQQARRRGRADL